MKKYIFWFFIIICIFQLNFVSAETDFVVKKTSSWDETYTNELKEVSVWTSVTFEISALGSSSSKDFQISIPSGFTYNNHSIWGNCSTQITTSTNNFFRYNFSGSNNCISWVTFSYTPNTSWSYTINILQWSTNISNVKIDVVWNNTVTKALSVDQNNNGFIDGYEIYFANPIANTSDFSSIKVWWQSITQYNWNTLSWIISFADNIFTTWELPQIISTGVSFGNIWTLSNVSIIEQDSANPILSKINNISVVNTNTGYISNGNIIFNFSEKLNPNKKDFVLKKWIENINGNYNFNDEELSFVPDTSLSVWNYQFSIWNNAEDFSQNKVISWNQKTLILTGNVIEACLWLPNNASWNNVSSITRFWNGTTWNPNTLTGSYNETASTNECRFTCNSWFHHDTGTCISNTKISACSGLPDNASWNSANSISQNWNGTTWNPNTLGTHNTSGSTSECRFTCNSGFTYNTWSNLCIDSQSPIWWNLGTWVGILINNGSQNTQTRYVNLSILAQDNVWVTQMMISNTSNFAWINWENYATGKAWTLTENNGTKTVYIKFRDASGNESPTYNDSIFYTPVESSLTFGSWISIYSNTSQIELFWNCKYIDTYGVENSQSIKYSINNTASGSLDCINNSWSGSLNILENTTNTIKIWFEENTAIFNSISIIHPTPACSIPTNGVATWVYPNCNFNCNTWFIKSGNSCIVASSWGWGGWWWWWWGWWWWGWVNVCVNDQLECSLQNGSYSWQRKSWAICTGWKLWQTCNLENQTWTWETNPSYNWEENQAEPEKNIVEIKDTLLSHSAKSLHKLILQIYNSIDYAHIDFFILSDNWVKTNYNLLIKNYESLFTNIDTYLKTKDKNALLEAKKNYDNFNTYYKLTQWLEEKYVTKVKKWSDIIYETKVEKIKWVLSQIEKIIIWKYKKQLSSWIISKSQYNENIKIYNNFVLYLSIYRQEKTSLSKEYGKKALETVIKNYSRK